MASWSLPPIQLNRAKTQSKSNKTSTEPPTDLPSVRQDLTSNQVTALIPSHIIPSSTSYMIVVLLSLVSLCVYHVVDED